MLAKKCRVTILLSILCWVLFACEASQSTSSNPNGGNGTGGTDSTVGTGTTNNDSGSNTGTGTGKPDNLDGGLNGCNGVDFLFIIDSSISMGDEQANAQASFPGFMAAISNTLQLTNFHIMVVDTDAIGENNNPGTHKQCGTDQCCIDHCKTAPPGVSCMGAMENKMCAFWNPDYEECDGVIGSGHTGFNTNKDCALQNGARYIQPGVANLNDAFACIADVGVDGSGKEKGMDAMVAAVSTLNAPGGCNEGFIREGSLLVVTLITDEDEQCTKQDEECAAGDPASWKQALVDAKGGVEEAIVFLGVFGDNDLPNKICEPMASAPPWTGAEEAPLLRTLVESFGEQGHYCSVCLPDYSECFNNAVSVINTACETLPPPM